MGDPSVGLFSDFTQLQQIAEANNSGNSGNVSMGTYHGYIGWPARMPNGQRNEKVLRLLHDGSVVVRMHERMTTQDGKFYDFVCLQSDHVPEPRDCPWCAQDQMYITRGLGLAIQREEKIEQVDGGGRRAVIADVLHDVDRENNTKETVPYLGLVKQAISNYWNNLAPLSYRYGTVMDRDYVVTRQGGDQKTSYSFIPCDPIEGLRTSEEVLARYSKALDGKDPGDILMEYIGWRSSEKCYKKFLGEDVFTKGAPIQPPDPYAEENNQQASASKTPDNPGVGGVDEFRPEEAGVHENTGTQFSALRDKLTTYKQQ